MIKIAFPISACAALDFYTAAMLAKQLGFDGVELKNAGDAVKTREIFAGSRIEIAALNPGCSVNQLSPYIEVARDLNCRFLRMKADGLFSRSGVVTPDAIDRLTTAGDLAAAAEVSILIQNQPTHGSALQLWHLLDRLNHPAIACCWDTESALRAEDTPAVAIPMLNSRIRYVQSSIDESGTHIHKTLDRLRGIGFGGYLQVEPPGDASQSVSALELSLIAAKSALQKWQILPTAVG